MTAGGLAVQLCGLLLISIMRLLANDCKSGGVGWEGIECSGCAVETEAGVSTQCHTRRKCGRIGRLLQIIIIKTEVT